MKKTIAIISVFFAFNCAFTQEYIPMPTSKTIWCEYNVIWQGGLNPLIVPRYMLLQGDTVLNNLTYYKIAKSYDTIIGNTDDFYFGCFREDTGKKVYLVLKDSLQETLIYDFSKNVNDTISFVGLYDTTLYIIDNIDSVFIDGNYRKNFSFDGSNLAYNFDWIEGVGSLGGLFYSFYPNGIEQNHELNCLSQDSSVVFQNPDSWLNDCFIFTDITTVNDINQDISVYPNPSMGIFYLDFNLEGQYEINIYSTIGHSVLKEKINNSRNQIDLSNLNPGYYILSIINPEYIVVYNEKLILKK